LPRLPGGSTILLRRRDGIERLNEIDRQILHGDPAPHPRDAPESAARSPPDLTD
jgi:hypothetical protein